MKELLTHTLSPKDEAITKAKEEGLTPFCVNATSGTTVLGVFEDLVNLPIHLLEAIVLILCIMPIGPITPEWNSRRVQKAWGVAPCGRGMGRHSAGIQEVATQDGRG